MNPILHRALFVFVVSVLGVKHFGFVKEFMVEAEHFLVLAECRLIHRCHFEFRWRVQSWLEQADVVISAICKGSAAKSDVGDDVEEKGDFFSKRRGSVALARSFKSHFKCSRREIGKGHRTMIIITGVNKLALISRVLVKFCMFWCLVHFQGEHHLFIFYVFIHSYWCLTWHGLHSHCSCCQRLNLILHWWPKHPSTPSPSNK